MNNSLIFALGEDGVLSIFDNVETIRQECEGIDVERGVWEFYDYTGSALKPKFYSPNFIKKHLFGIFGSVTSSQNFSLVPDKEELSLLKCLTNDTLLEKNFHFKDLGSVYEYLL